MAEDDENGQAGWLVASTQPHKEQLAIRNLQQQDLVVYCPMMVRRIRHARRAYDARRPIFPGYVFVDFQSTGGFWRRVRSTIGVRNIILNGDRPGLAPNGLIEALRAREIDGIVRKPSEDVKVGQTIKVQGGAFDGFVGQVLDVRSDERILMLLNLFSNPMKVEIGKNQVDVVRPSA